MRAWRIVGAVALAMCVAAASIAHGRETGCADVAPEARGRPCAEPARPATRDEPRSPRGDEPRWSLVLPIALDRGVPALPIPGPSATLPASPSPTPPTTPSATPDLGPGVVHTRSGPIAGVRDGTVWRYLGIPYAAPPVGELRWRPPQPPEPWSAPLAASAFGAVCPQYDEGGAVVGDEDCLTLNVWAPEAALADGRLRPVLLFIHGGGHEQGSASAKAGDRPLYDGRALASDHDLVVVTIQYRVGPFGFLAHPALTSEGGPTASGNYGALDQLSALRWAHDNISAFGGDPARVTVFGQSAGSVSTCRLVVSPLAAGLLQRAVLMSGACVATTLARAEAHGQEVAADLGCASNQDVPACLRGESTAEVMATLDPMPNGTDALGRMTYDGVIDGHLLPAAPRDLIAAGLHNSVPVLVGTTSAENGRNAPRITTEAEYEAAVRLYFQRSGLPATLADRALAVYPAGDYRSPRDAYVALTSDAKFVCQARIDARALAAPQDAPVFRYLFDHVPENGGAPAQSLGAWHGIELPFLFGVLEFGLGSVRYRPGAGDLSVSSAMQGYWARFAATGDPNGDAAAPWPTYSVESDPYLRLAPQPSAEVGLHTAQCDFWDSLAHR